MKARLRLLYSYLRLGWPVWDFGCDHGYLGETAGRSGSFPEIYFVDRVRRVINHLQERLTDESSDFPDCPTHFMAVDATANSLSPVGNLVIAGMGGLMVINILRQQIPQPRPDARLILCPNKDAELVREYLQQIGWKLVDDTLVVEHNKFREIIVCETAGESLQLFGNHFPQNAPDLFRAYWLERLHFFQQNPHPSKEWQHYMDCLKNAQAHK